MWREAAKEVGEERWRRPRHTKDGVEKSFREFGVHPTTITVAIHPSIQPSVRRSVHPSDLSLYRERRASAAKQQQFELLSAQLRQFIDNAYRLRTHFACMNNNETRAMVWQMFARNPPTSPGGALIVVVCRRSADPITPLSSTTNSSQVSLTAGVVIPGHHHTF